MTGWQVEARPDSEHIAEVTNTLSDFRGWSHFSEPIKLSKKNRHPAMPLPACEDASGIAAQSSRGSSRGALRYGGGGKQGPVEFTRIGMFLCVGEAGQERSDTSRAIHSMAGRLPLVRDTDHIRARVGVRH